tara:strand:- start:675 stop:1055 length:381 start_codon:yes stop_codon:yes gene_type:complete
MFVEVVGEVCFTRGLVHCFYDEFKFNFIENLKNNKKWDKIPAFAAVFSRITYFVLQIPVFVNNSTGAPTSYQHMVHCEIGSVPVYLFFQFVSQLEPATATATAVIIDLGLIDLSLFHIRTEIDLLA